MVATQPFSISRRTLDIDDYIDVVRRHIGLIAGPAFIGAVVTVCIAFSLSNEYTSKAAMEITPPQINENMVATTISNSLNDRVTQMEQEILSRQSLSQMVLDPHLQLYKREQATVTVDDVVETMRNNIKITPIALTGALGRRAFAFNIEFTYYDRFKAQQTVQVLMDKFHESNQGTQKNGEDQVTGLVGDLLSQARADRQKASDELTKFKQANDGKLPEDSGLNVAMMNSSTEKIRGVAENIYRDTDQKQQLETQRSNLNNRLSQLDELEQLTSAAAMPGSPTAKVDPRLTENEAMIEKLKFTLSGLKKSFTDSYPLVKTTQKALQTYEEDHTRLVAEIKAKADAEAARPKDAVAKSGSDVRIEASRSEIKETLATITATEKRLDDDIVRLTKEREAYAKESDELSRKVKESTALESDYQDLRRNQQMAETNYQEYMHKQQMTMAEQKLISRRAGENLEVLDTASLPMIPASPNRPRFIGIGFALSIIIGLCVAGAQEAKDTSLKNLKDVRAYTNLPVLCSIPLLENTMLVKRKRRLTYLAWSAAVIVGAAAVAAAVFYYETVTLKG